MNWYDFEALCSTIDHLSMKGIFEDSSIEDEANEIAWLTRDRGVFSDDLKMRAIRLHGVLNFYTSIAIERSRIQNRELEVNFTIG